MPSSPVTVAVIDSGVNPDHPHVGRVADGIAIAADGSLHDNWIDRLGHGTAVAAAIHEKAPSVQLLAIRVFERRLATSAPVLARAIDWAADHGARFINLSLGTPNAAHAALLQAAVDRARARESIVVSAAEYEGRRWYPGSLEGTVGVLLDWECPRESIRNHESGRRMLFAASGYPRPIPGVPREKNLKGISFAVANVTGTLAWNYSKQ
jgi:subtilisin family serine protease